MPRAGVEPAAYSLGGSRSIQLSYRGAPRSVTLCSAAVARGRARRREQRCDRLTGRFARRSGFVMVRRRISVPQGELSAGRALLSAFGGGNQLITAALSREALA